jgi:DmsE family decaheme c-type cytochrome
MAASKRVSSAAVGTLCLVAVLFGSGDLDTALGGTAAAEPALLAQAVEGGAETCLQCHSDAATAAVLRTPHAQTADKRTPFAKQQCETCHGAGAEHVENFGGVEIAIRFGRDAPTPVAEQNAVCLGCHERGARMNWHMSAHEANGVACVTCHSLHAVKDRMLVKTRQTEVCVTCHREQRAGLFKRSRHPLREGILSCASCHNAHGAFGSVSLVRASVNETCFTCHQEKRGPFLWEHQPVTEDCTICHSPHGSNQPRLLKARGPQLCQTCHTAGSHSSRLYGGNSVPPFGANSRILADNCINCHPRVHGSNHPSGPLLTR